MNFIVVVSLLLRDKFDKTYPALCVYATLYLWNSHPCKSWMMILVSSAMIFGYLMIVTVLDCSAGTYTIYIIRWCKICSGSE